MQLKRSKTELWLGLSYLSINMLKIISISAEQYDMVDFCMIWYEGERGWVSSRFRFSRFLSLSPHTFISYRNYPNEGLKLLSDWFLLMLESILFIPFRFLGWFLVLYCTKDKDLICAYIAYAERQGFNTERLKGLKYSKQRLRFIVTYLYWN